MRAPHSSHALQPVSSQVLVQSFVTPPGKVYLLYGDNLIFQLSLRMAASAMAQGKPIAVVDGCNQFNVHLLSRFARERHLNPEQFLNLIFISRGFTCYQMEQAIASRLPVFLEDIHSNTAMIFGLLDTFYDEQAPFREVQQILKRLLLVLQNMKADGISVLLTCTQWNVLPRERNQLFATLRSGMDRVYRLELSEAHGPQLFLESTVEDAVPLMLTARAGSAIHPTQTCREKGDDLYGTNGSDVYQHYRQRDRKLVKVPPGTAPGGPGNLR
ncbi:MAG: hypothetical protein FJ217_09965 [Ignavibacteria bacterium]|nr:hypothetical protein [Ignavibacteria bacterium]